MKYAGDLTAYTLDGTSVLDTYTNVSFKVSAQVEEGKGGSTRHSLGVPVKRSFEAKTEIMRDVSGARQTSLTMTVFSFGVTVFLAKIRSATINVATANQECSARADEFMNYQVTGTKVTGSGEMQILDADTTTLMETVNGTLAGLSTTISITVGGVTLVLPVVLSGVELKTERDGLILVSFDWEQRGTPTTVSGSSLLTTAITGDALVTFVATITTIGTYTGTTLVESCTLTIPDAGILTEQYNFKGMGTLVKS